MEAPFEPDSQVGIAELSRGHAFYERGDLASAEAYYRHVPLECTRRNEAMLGLARVLLSSRRFREAESVLRQLMQEDTSPELNLFLGHALMNLGSHAEALATFQRAAMALPRDFRPLILAGQVEGLRGRWRDAIKFFESAVKLVPRELTPRYQLANAYVQIGQFLPARTHLARVLSEAPNYQPAQQLAGDIAYKIKDFKEAIKAYVRAETISELGPETLVRLGDAYKQIGEFEYALLALNKAIERDETCWAAYLAAGKLCETPRDWLLARRYYRALELIPEVSAESRDGLQRANALGALAPATGSSIARQVPERLEVPDAKRSNVPPSAGGAVRRPGQLPSTRTLPLSVGGGHASRDTQPLTPPSNSVPELREKLPLPLDPNAGARSLPPQRGTQPLALPPQKPSDTRRSSFGLGTTGPLKPKDGGQ